MASQDERRKFVESFLASPELATLSTVHRNIYRGQVLEMLATLGARAIDSFSGRDLDAFLIKKGRSPDHAVAEKVGTALLRHLGTPARGERISTSAPPAEATPVHTPAAEPHATAARPPSAPPPSAAPPGDPGDRVPVATSPGYAAMTPAALAAGTAGKPAGATTMAGISLQKGLQYRTTGPRGDAIKGQMMVGILNVGRAFMRRGTPLDLSLACLRTLDAYFEREAPGGQPGPTSDLTTRRNDAVLEIAAYLSAVIAGAVGGGVLEIDEDDPEAALNLRLVLPNGHTLNPVMRVIGRLDLGASQSLAAYGQFAAGGG